MEAGVFQVVALTGGGDGAHIADVLHHGGQGQGHDGHRRGEEHPAVQVRAAEQTEQRILELEGEPDPGSVDQRLDLDRVHDLHPVDLADGGHCVGTHHAQQDGDDFDHSLAPDVAAHHNGDGDEGDGPVGSAVGDGGGAEGQADTDDDGAGDDGREVTHDPFGAKDAEQGGKQDIHQSGQHDAEAGVGQHLRVGDCVAIAVGEHGGDGLIAADEGEGGAQEGGDHPLGQKVEQQSAQPGEEQGGGHGQPGEGGDQHGGSEHGEHVLDAQDQHFGAAQLAGIIDALVWIHSFVLPSQLLVVFCAEKKTINR